MVTTRQIRAIVGICIVSSLFAQGCATTPVTTVPSREQLGTVGIVAIGLPPKPESLGPIGPHAEAGRGARQGILVGAEAGAGTGFLAGLACGPWFVICSPFGFIAGAAGGAIAGAAGGAIAGNANALPAETAAELEAALRTALAGRDLQSELAERVLVRAKAGEGPEVVGLGAGEGPETAAPPDYTRFTTGNVKTVLELGIAQIGLTREERGEAPFSLLIIANARLVRLSDHKVLWSDEKISVLSPPEDLAAWTTRGADLLQTEINAGLERLALRIHGQVFGLT